jgi:hypothetical protein
VASYFSIFTNAAADSTPSLCSIRWMVSHGWNTYIQVCPEAELLSTMKPDWRFLKQVLRWTRNTWRSDIRSIFKERYIWTRHPYVAYCMIDKVSSRA